MEFRKKFPFYPQYDVMDCGPACLRMVAKYAGKHYTLQKLRKYCYINREGVSMLGISDAAESIGFRTLGTRVKVVDLASKATLPCILHWNKNHFVVLYKIREVHCGRFIFYIADPASGLARYTQEEFERCWCSTTNGREREGTALLLTPGPDFDRIDEEQEYSTKKDLLFFVRYLIPYKKQFIQLLFGMALSSLIQIMFPFFTQLMVDIGIGNHNLGFITLVLISQLTLFWSQLVIGFLRSWILLHINSRIDIALISDFLMKLMKLPLSYFDTKMTGDIMQRIGDHSRIKSFLMGNTVNLLFSVVNFFVFVVILGYYHLFILFIFILGNSLQIIWMFGFLRFRRELDIKRFNQSAGEQNKIIITVR